MKTIASALTALLISQVSVVAFAQNLSPVPQPPPPVAPPAVAAPSVLPSDFCALGEHSGIDETDAQTTASIVCEEVRRHQNIAGGRFYRVQINRLGMTVFLSLQAEQPAGTMLDRRQMQIPRIEEVPIIAPRLVSALLENKSIQQTESVNNIAGDEARVRQRKSGEMMFGVGLSGQLVTGTSPFAPGGILALAYESDRIGLTGEFRFSGGESGSKSNGGDSFTAVGFGIGGRYFVLDSDVTPVIGAGLQALSLSQRRSDDTTYGTSYSKFGLGAYGEVGVEALRTHKVRLLASARADLPFYSVEGTNYVNAPAGSPPGTTGTSTSVSAYAVPLSINLAIYFKF